MAYRSVQYKPENILIRAEELINIDHKEDALAALHEGFATKKFKTWSEAVEKVILKLLEICIDLKRPKLAKDALYQYRIICQNASAVPSLALVIDYLLKTAEAKAAEAHAKMLETQEQPEPKADLDALPLEEFMLHLAIGEAADEKHERNIFTPWMKFLWESYRAVLELLKTHPKFEHLYHKIAKESIQLWEKYDRKQEFRRLCDLLRNHQQNLIKYNNNSSAVSIHTPDTLLQQFETRFYQLNVATNMKAWQEAYKLIEDISQLMLLTKRPIKPQMMASYYQQLALLFKVSNNILFHAYTWFKFFVLSKSQHVTLSKEEIQAMASIVVLASLSIPLPREKSAYASDDSQKEKKIRLAALLGFSSDIDREVLLAEVSKKVLPFAHPELIELHDLLEKKFRPLSLCKALAPYFEFISSNETLKPYLPHLQELAFLRTLQQLSTVYEAMHLKELWALCPFIAKCKAEKFIVQAVREGLVDARIDYQNQAINFGSQALESVQIKNQLTAATRRIKLVAEMIFPKSVEDKEKERNQIFLDMIEHLSEEHRRILNKKQIIEKRKEIQEQKQIQLRLQKQKEREEREKIEAQQQQELQEQLERERKEREEKLAALKTEQNQEKPDWVNPLNNLNKEVSDVPEVVPGLLVETESKEEAEKQEQEALEREQRAKVEFARKIDNREKKLYFKVRAKREKEVAAVRKWYEVMRDKYVAQFKKEDAERRRVLKANYEARFAEKQRLGPMFKHTDCYEEDILGARKSKYEKEKAAQDERMDGLRQQIKELKEKKRREAEEAKQKKIQEEQSRLEREKQRKEEEALMRQQEEEERLARQKEQPSRSVPANRPYKRYDTPTTTAATTSAPSSSDKYVPKWRKEKSDDSQSGDYNRNDRAGSGDRESRSGSGDRESRSGSGDRESRYGSRDSRYGGGDRESRYGGSDRYGSGDRYGSRNDRAGSGDRESRYGGGDRYGSRNDRDSRYGSGDRESRYGGGDRESRYGGGDRYGSRNDRGGSGDRESRYGGGDRYGSRNDRDSREGSGGRYDSSWGRSSSSSSSASSSSASSSGASGSSGKYVPPRSRGNYSESRGNSRGDSNTRSNRRPPTTRYDLKEKEAPKTDADGFVTVSRKKR